MSTSDFIFIVDKVKKELPLISTLTIAGFGEFSMDPDWKQKLTYAKSSFSGIHVLTNLSLFSEEDIRFLLDHITTVRISLYGLTEEKYNRVHHPKSASSYSRVMENLSFLNRYKTKDQRILLNFLELEENRDQREILQKDWAGKADGIDIWRPHNWINGKDYRSLCHHRLDSCGRPFMGPIQVQVDSTVNVCCFDYNGELEIGDLKKNSFREIFSGETMAGIQRLHKEGHADSLPLCAICDQRNCTACKSGKMIYSSDFNAADRVVRTSTSFESLDDY